MAKKKLTKEQVEKLKERKNKSISEREIIKK